jgi:hypothetical protein
VTDECGQHWATQADCTLDAASNTSVGGWQEQVEAADVQEDQENQWYTVHKFSN